MDKNGKITALKAGTVTITLKGGSKVLEVQVKIIGKKRPPKKDSEDPSEDDPEKPDDGSSDSGEESEDSPSESRRRRAGKGLSETSGSWKFTGAGWSFLLADGTAAKGQWILTGGKWYYIGADGIMRTGWLLDQGRWYYQGKIMEKYTDLEQAVRDPSLAIITDNITTRRSSTGSMSNTKSFRKD